MDVGQNAINQAAIARAQINQQIKTNREIIAAARKQIQELVEMQITEAKEKQRKLAAEAASEAAQAKMSARGQTAPTGTDAPTQLAQLILLLSEGTGVNQEEVAQEIIEATQAASKIVEKVSQVFNPPLANDNDCDREA